jgi:hypothetical protein
MMTSMPKKLSVRSNGRILGRTSEAQKGFFVPPKRGPISGSELQGKTCSGNGRYGSEVGYYWGCDNPLSVGKGEQQQPAAQCYDENQTCHQEGRCTRMKKRRSTRLDPETLSKVQSLARRKV